jgi:hypothetical protein
VERVDVSSNNISISNLEEQLNSIETQYTSSNLVIYVPKDEHEKFFNNLCQLYLDASVQERRLILKAVADKKGILNAMLGHIYQSAEQLRLTGDRRWLQIGLVAKVIEQGNYDPRDLLLALAELYVTAEEVGLDPQHEFEVIGRMADFDNYAVVKSRRRRPK